MWCWPSEEGRGAGEGEGEGNRGRWGGEAERERGKGEAVCYTTWSRSTTTGWLLQGWGSVKGGLLSVCMCAGGQEERQRRGESYPGTPGAICHIGMALELPGRPLIAGEFSGRGVGNREGLGAAERGQRSWPTQARAVRPLPGQAGGWRERKEAKKGVVGKPGACQGSVFLGMLVKPAGEISV